MLSDFVLLRHSYFGVQNSHLMSLVLVLRSSFLLYKPFFIFFLSFRLCFPLYNLV